MELNKIEMSRGDARRHYQEYRTALKQQRTRQIAELAITYWQLSRGRQVIDVFEAFKAAGLKDDGSALALCRADRKQVFLEKQFDGSAKFFGMSEGDIRQGRNPDFELPRDFFAWKRTNGLQNGPIFHPRCRTTICFGKLIDGSLRLRTIRFYCAGSQQTFLSSWRSGISRPLRRQSCEEQSL